MHIQLLLAYSSGTAFDCCVLCACGLGETLTVLAMQWGILRDTGPGLWPSGFWEAWGTKAKKPQIVQKRLFCETLFLYGRTSSPEHEDRLVKMLSLMGPSGRPVRVLLTMCPRILLARPTAECSRTSSTNLWAGQRMFLLSQ